MVLHELYQEFSQTQERDYLVCVQIENTQKSERVALYPICFYRGTYQRLGENQIGQLMQLEERCVGMEELLQ